MLSIIIPSRKEIFLNHTIRDVLKNATQEIEVFPVLDGYEPDELIEDPRVTYIRLPEAKHTQKRHGINKAVEMSNGKFVMSLDAHCMVAPGFDEVLTRDCKEENWVMIPRRQRLDAENWCIEKDERPPIDYEYIIFSSLIKDRSIHGFRWDARTIERMDIPMENTLEFQGSAWLTRKTWFNKIGLMAQLDGEMDGYRGWGAEAEEVSFKTYKAGGEVKTDKNTFYCHWHKGKSGRGYWMSRQESRMSYAYAFNKWVIEERDFFISLIEKFAPLPQWPSNWKDKIYKLGRNPLNLNIGEL